MNPRFLKKAISLVIAMALLMMSCIPVMAEDIHTPNPEPKKPEVAKLENANPTENDDNNNGKEQPKADDLNTVKPGEGGTGEGGTGEGGTGEGGTGEGGTGEGGAGEGGAGEGGAGEGGTGEGGTGEGGAGEGGAGEGGTGEGGTGEGGTGEGGTGEGGTGEGGTGEGGTGEGGTGEGGAGEGGTGEGGTGEEAKPKALSECDITITPKSVTYNGESHKPKIEIKDGEETLVENKDYKVVFQRDDGKDDDFTSAGIISILIYSSDETKYTNNNGQPIVKVFEIKKKSIEIKVSKPKAPFTYDGTEHKLVPEVKMGNTDLEVGEDKDFTVSYKRGENETDNFIDVGEIKVVVTLTDAFKNAHSNYSFGNLGTSYEIVKANAEITVSNLESVTYDGTEHKLVPRVEMGNTELKVGEDKDFTVSYKRGENETDNFIDVGEIKVVVTLTDAFKNAHSNYSFGDLGTSYKIVKANAIITVSDPKSVTYDGTEHELVPKVEMGDKVLEVGKDKDFTVSYKRGENGTDDFKNVGEITVVVTLTDKFKNAHSNYSFDKINADSLKATYTIEPKSLDIKESDITVTLDKSSYTYDGESHQPKITVEMIKEMGNNIVLEEGDEKDYTVTYKRGDVTYNSGDEGADNFFKDAGVITVVITGQGNFKESREITYTIEKLNVTLTVANQEKNYGEKTPEFTVKYESEDVEDVTVFAEEIKGLVSMTVDGKDLEIKDGDGQTLKFAEGTGENKLSEEPGEYTIAIGDLGNSGNFVFSVTNEGKATYTIGNEIRLTVPEKIYSHTAKLDGFEVKCVADEGEVMTEFATMAENIKLTATISNLNGVVIPYTYDEFAFKWKYDDENFTVSNGQALNTTVFFDGVNDWETYIPAGMVITYTAKTENDADLVIIGEDGTETVPETEVVATPVTITVSATKNRFYSEAKEEVEYFILDEEASLFVTANDNDEKGGITSEDWIEFKNAVNPEDVFYFKANENGQIEIDPYDIKLLLNESEDYMNPDPQNYAEIIFTMVDKHNHTVEDKTIRLCVDTGAVAGGVSTVGNREKSNIAMCDLLDSVGKITSIVGHYGCLDNLTHDAPVDQKLKINLTGWQDNPSTLPHSGDVITIKYLDKVGHEVTHTLNVVKSPAGISNTINITPEYDGTVGAEKLKFWGKTTSCEKLILRIGGKTITIDPRMHGSYDFEGENWSYSLKLSELGIPVGVQQTVTIAYDDLAGGEAITHITYKDHALKPSLSCDLVEGAMRFWGFVEENAQDMYINIQRADGSVTRITEAMGNLLLNKQYGYFYVKLKSDEKLNAGDVVEFTITDLCGNKINYSLTVGAETKPHRAALLGAKIADEIDGEYVHTFATPLLLEKDFAGQSMTLPILAYDGIEIGTMTLALNGTKIDMEYNISKVVEDENGNVVLDPNYFAEDARVYYSAYGNQPELNELLNAHHRTKKLEVSGKLESIDVSEYMDENGELKGLVWLYAAVDASVAPAELNKRPAEPVYLWDTLENIEGRYGNGITYAGKQQDYYNLFYEFYNRAH